MSDNLIPVPPGWRLVYTERADVGSGAPTVQPITHWGLVNGFMAAFLQPPGSSEPAPWTDFGDDSHPMRIVDPENTSTDAELIEEYQNPPEEPE